MPKIKIKGLENAWKNEKEKHLGDYGDSSEYDLYCAFRAGWLASKYHHRTLHKRE